MNVPKHPFFVPHTLHFAAGAGNWRLVASKELLEVVVQRYRERQFTDLHGLGGRIGEPEIPDQGRATLEQKGLFQAKVPEGPGPLPLGVAGYSTTQPWRSLPER